MGWQSDPRVSAGTHCCPHPLLHPLNCTLMSGMCPARGTQSPVAMLGLCNPLGTSASTWRGLSPLKVQCELGETSLPVGSKGCLWGSLSCPSPYLFLFCSLWISLVCSSSCFSSLVVDKEFSWSCISIRHV